MIYFYIATASTVVSISNRWRSWTTPVVTKMLRLETLENVVRLKCSNVIVAIIGLGETKRKLSAENVLTMSNEVMSNNW